MDYFLKFESQSQAQSVLFEETTEVQGGEQGDVVETVYRPKYDNIDVIGTITRAVSTADMTEGTDPAEVTLETLAGWHVNVRHSGDAQELSAFVVEPKNPIRVWA